MNTFNRVLIVLGVVLVMAVMTATFVMPQVILTNVGQWMQSWGVYFGSVQPAIRFIIGLALAAVFNLVFILVIFFEVRPSRKKFIRVQQVSGGMATLSIDSIVHQLQHRLGPLPGVIKVNPKIKARGDKVQAIVDVEVGAGSSVPNMASQLVARVHTVLEDDLGLQVSSDPEVRLRVSSNPAPRKLPESPDKPKPPELPEKPKSEPEAESPPPPPLPIEERHDWAGLNPEEDDVQQA